MISLPCVYGRPVATTGSSLLNFNSGCRSGLCGVQGEPGFCETAVEEAVLDPAEPSANGADEPFRVR